MGWQKAEEMEQLPTSVSDVVDPSAMVTDPGNPNFRPKNRAELQTAIASLVKDASDDDAASLYDAVKSIFVDTKDEEKKMLDKKVEHAVRTAVRRIIKEVGEYSDTGLSYSGPVSGADSEVAEKAVALTLKQLPLDSAKTDPVAFLKVLISKVVSARGNRMANVVAAIDLIHEVDEEAGEELESALEKNPNLVPRRNEMMTDVEGASLPDIAKALGLKSHGKLQSQIDTALDKARFFVAMDPDEKQIMFLGAMNDYIDHLRSSGELTPADVQLLKDHPDMVADLDGFREFLDDYYKKYRAKKGI
jgi:hypothetical protein